MLSKYKISKVLKILKESYPDAKPELNFKNPFELLIATMLSAQSTDKRVNIVTEGLFDKCKTPEDYLKLTQEELEDIIRSIGFYRNKSKNILKTCKLLVEDYNSEVPNSREELVKLPGVGRKTANVVISNAFSIPAIAVDTHVFRVSNRLGIAESDNVDKTEQDLMKNIPKKDWTDAHHWLIFHGRRVCASRKPKCEKCPLIKYCVYYLNEVKK